MIAERAEYLDLPTSEVLRLLSNGTLLSIVDLDDWFRPFYFDPKNYKWYFDRDDVFSYIQLINQLNTTYRAYKANEAVGNYQAA